MARDWWQAEQDREVRQAERVEKMREARKRPAVEAAQ
jgi:hypothetical protein